MGERKSCFTATQKNVRLLAVKELNLQFLIGSVGYLKGFKSKGVESGTQFGVELFC